MAFYNSYIPDMSIAGGVDELRLHVPRPRLVRNLVERSPDTVVLIVAPAGYGKTTVLREWTEAESRPVIWLSCDRVDADPVVLIRDLAIALDQYQPLPEEVFLALDRSLAIPGEALRRMRDATREWMEPIVLVLDDCHHLQTDTLLAEVVDLVGTLPDGSTMALAGRSTLDLPLGRLRMEGGLLEIGAEDLALSRTQARALLENTGVHLGTSAFDELYNVTEGWAAGLQLATIGLGEHARVESKSGTVTIAKLHPDKRYLAEYLTEEVLSCLDDDVMEFLRASSILDPMSGPLCDAVLERTDSAAVLEYLVATKSLFISALDSERDWYRYHRLFADVLEADLRRSDPDLHQSLHRRASLWFEGHGDVDAAVRHTIAARDAVRVGALILGNTDDYVARGQNETLGLWLAEVDEQWLRSVPDLAFAAVLHALRAGDLEAAGEQMTWARATPDTGRLADGTPSLAVGLAMVTAIAGRERLEYAVRQTEIVRRAGREGNPWWSLATGLQGACEVQMGNIEVGRALLEEVLPSLRHAPDWCSLCLTNLALADIEQDNWTGAAGRSRDACMTAESHGLENLPVLVLTWSVAAMIEARVGSNADARARLARAEACVEAIGTFGSFAKGLQVLVPALLADAHLALGDIDAAKALRDRAESARTTNPRAVIALRRLDAVNARLLEVRDTLPSGMSITAAERRVLDLLPTHASMREIAEELFVARNTVKTHALSLYRKLGVSSRTDAVHRARETHLLDG